MIGWRWTTRGRALRPVPSRFRLILAQAALGVAGIGVASSRGHAQFLERPWLEWQTLHAGRFAVHHPRALTTWAEYVARRMPSVDSAVANQVGFTPRGRVDIVVEDPYSISNGIAYTDLERPVIVFWASPPDPREMVGQFRSWGEMLAVHEFAHIAHLTRPSRNAMTRVLWRLSPIDLGPIAVRAPRWVLEGYATYLEGKLTGSGRPHGFWRPAVLRQWAIEGHLPTYAQLSSWGDFEGGHFAYLAGSAFLEWLARRQGDSSLVHVWRRLTARVNRGFDQAFVGVYGDTPALLYGRFVAELTADAMAAERELSLAGIVEGEVVQRLAWGTGDPAISPEGSRVAVVMRSRTRPARLVVWRTAAEPDTLESRARERILRRDPEDVPARRFYPPPKRPLATLLARGGRAFEEPRWLPDGRRLLLTRSARRPDGSVTPDLYEWTVGTRAVRRLTSGAGLRAADPAPDGERAVALRCHGGSCDIVLVELRTGAITTLATGDTLTSYAHPRFSPDGRSIAVARHRDDRWRIVLLDVGSSRSRFGDPDDGANRFDPAWSEPSSLVVTSDRTGTANLERIDVGEGDVPVARTLTRVTGAAVAPAPNRVDGSIWFLSLHSRGYDVRRLAPSTRVPNDTAAPLRDPRLIPAALDRPVAPPPVFAPSALTPARQYGIGARLTRWVPTAAIGADGRAAGVALVNSDVVGRLSVLAQGVWGNGGAWRGASMDAVWRSRPALRVSGFSATQGADASGPATSSLGHILLKGASGRVDFTHAFDLADFRASAGFSHSRLSRSTRAAESTVVRPLAFVEAAWVSRQTGDRVTASESFWVSGTGGRNGPEDFVRTLATLGVRAGAVGAPALDLSVTYGRVSSTAPPFERFSLGGLAPSLVDGALLTQRLSMPALPAGVAAGDRALVYHAATRVGALSPYYWGASARDGAGRLEQWHRVTGVELLFDEGPLAVLGTPGARFIAGVARSLDEPFAKRTRGYVTVTLRP